MYLPGPTICNFSSFVELPLSGWLSVVLFFLFFFLLHSELGLVLEVLTTAGIQLALSSGTLSFLVGCRAGSCSTPSYSVGIWASSAASVVLLFFLLIGIDVSWIMFACWSEFLICFVAVCWFSEYRYSWCSVCWESWLMSRCRGSSRQALVGIHVFAGIGFCGLPLAFDVGWVCFLCWGRWSMVAEKLLVICLLYAVAGIFMVVALVGQYDMGMLLPFSVLGRQLVACVSSAL